MGKIADAIEEVEDELAELKEDFEALQKSYNDVLQENDSLQERIEHLTKIVDDYNNMEDYLDENHPGVVTAYEVAKRMEKVNGQG